MTTLVQHQSPHVSLSSGGVYTDPHSITLLEGGSNYSSSQHSLSYYYDAHQQLRSSPGNSNSPPISNLRTSFSYNDDINERTRLVPVPQQQHRQKVSDKNLQSLDNNNNNNNNFPKSSSYRSIPNTDTDNNNETTNTKSVFTNIKRSKSKKLRTSPMIRNNSIISTNSVHSKSLPLPDFQASSNKTKNLAYSWRIKQDPKRRSVLSRQRRKQREEVVSNYQNSKQLYSLYKMLSSEDLPVSYLPQYLLEYSINSKDLIKKNPTLRYQIKKCNFQGKDYQLSLSPTDKTIFEYYNISKPRNIDPPHQKFKNSTTNHKHSKTLSSGGNVINFSNQDINEARDKYDLKTETNKNKKSIRFSEIPQQFIRNSKYGEISNLTDTQENYNLLKNLVFSKKFKNTKDLLIFLNTSREVDELTRSNSNLISRLLLEIYLRRIIAAKMAIKIGILKSRSSMWSNSSGSGFASSSVAGSRVTSTKYRGTEEDVSSDETRLRLSEFGQLEEDIDTDSGDEDDSNVVDVWEGLIDVIKSVYGSQQTEFFTEQM